VGETHVPAEPAAAGQGFGGPAHSRGLAEPGSSSALRSACQARWALQGMGLPLPGLGHCHGCCRVAAARPSLWRVALPCDPACLGPGQPCSGWMKRTASSSTRAGTAHALGRCSSHDRCRASPFCGTSQEHHNPMSAHVLASWAGSSPRRSQLREDLGCCEL